MADRWIVSAYKFAEHRKLLWAQQEAARLAEKTGKEFRVYRIKKNLANGSSLDRVMEIISEYAGDENFEPHRQKLIALVREFQKKIDYPSQRIPAQEAA